MILSSVSEPGLDKTAEASGEGFKIFQLYVRGDAEWVDDHVGARSTRAMTPSA